MQRGEQSVRECREIEAMRSREMPAYVVRLQWLQQQRVRATPMYSCRAV